MTEQEILRRESLQKLRELGIEPFPAEMFDVTASAADIVANYQEEVLEDGTKNRLNYKEVALAGRIMAPLLARLGRHMAAIGAGLEQRYAPLPESLGEPCALP